MPSESKMRILFCSRGRGRGHAVRDLEIVKELRCRSEDIEIAFASYDAGFNTLRCAGENVFDLCLPERNPFPETVIRVGHLLRRFQPTLVVAQEEFAAITAAKLFELRAVFTSHWFPHANSMFSNALLQADRVLFMEEEGLFPEPQEVRGKVVYCGPLMRPVSAHITEANLIRQELGISANIPLILVLPGSPPEKREPIVDLIRESFKIIGMASASLLWVAGADYELIRSQLSDTPGAHIIQESSRILELINASDLVINKGTYNIGREILAIGRRAISLSHGYNWVDDVFSQRWPNSTFLRAKDVNADQLSALITATLSLTSKLEPKPPDPGSAGRVADAILRECAQAKSA